MSLFIPIKIMKKIKLTLMLLFVCLCAQISLFANEPKTTIEQLMAHRWQWEAPLTYKASVEFIGWFYFFSPKLALSVMRYEGQDRDQPSDWFYLSDRPEFEFDESKVGKTQNGKYIVRAKMKDIKDVTVDEIIELTDKMLKVRTVTPLHNNGNINTFVPYNGKYK